MSTALLWCAEYSHVDTWRSRLPARELCVSYPLLATFRTGGHGISWRAGCDRRRVLPPKCKRRHELGASGDRASSPHGHEVLVIAPDTPRGEPPAARVHDGVRVHRVPSRMFPKVTSLPLGIPRPRMVGCCGASTPTSCTWRRRRSSGGGLHAARHSACPRSRYSRPTSPASPRATAWCHVPGGVGMDADAAHQGRPHAGPVHLGDGKACRSSHPAGAQLGARSRHQGLRPVGPRRGVAGPLVAAGQVDGGVRRPVGSREARRTARGLGAATTFNW